MILYLDIDDTLADFTGDFIRLFNRYNRTKDGLPGKWMKKDVTGWNMQPILPQWQHWWEYTEKEPGFWRFLNRLPYARRIVEATAQSRYPWAFCTSLPHNHPGVLDDRRVWLEHNFGYIEPNIHTRLIVAKRKELVVHEGDVLIDDSVTNFDAVQSVGGIVVLRAQPWNKGFQNRMEPEDIVEFILDL